MREINGRLVRAGAVVMEKFEIQVDDSEAERLL
jgi:hypothetical protein